MSPRRRQPRVAVSPKGVPSAYTLATRSGSSHISKSPSTIKPRKPVKASPARRQLSVQPNVSSPKQIHSPPIAPSRTPRTSRTPLKSPRKSPVKSVNSRREEPQVDISTIKISPSKVKKEPGSPSISIVTGERHVNTTPKRTASKLPVSSAHDASPTQQRVTRGLSACRSPSSSTLRTPRSSPLKSIIKAEKLSPNKWAADCSKPQSPSSRKRPLPSPSKSPHSAKVKRLRGKVLIPPQIDNTTNSKIDCNISDGDKRDFVGSKTTEIKSSGLSSFSQENTSEDTTSTQSLTELSGRFLRRKWFSLKTRGGFTCLRSAILTPQEIATEVLKKTMVDTAPILDTNFFSTKLMVRLSSKLPPVRSRPSCEELADLTGSKQSQSNVDPLVDPKGEGTAIRVKVEKRSFSDTISHVVRKPSKVPVVPFSAVKSVALKPGPRPKNSIHHQAESTLTKKQEREIALRQLKNLKKL